MSFAISFEIIEMLMLRQALIDFHKLNFILFWGLTWGSLKVKFLLKISRLEYFGMLVKLTKKNLQIHYIVNFPILR